jgi:hypothetical protein
LGAILNESRDKGTLYLDKSETKLPLKFDTIAQEVNLIALLELLNFCSGYRVELKRLTGRGAFDTIRGLILSLHISQWDLSARGLAEVTEHDIVEMGQIPVSEDVKHEVLEGVTASKPTNLKRMVENIVSVLRETGEILKKGGYQSLGIFIIECAKRSSIEGKGVSASMFIHHVYRPISVLSKGCQRHTCLSRYGYRGWRASLYFQKGPITCA